MPWLSRMDALAAKLNPMLELLIVGLAILVGTVALAQGPAPTRPPVVFDPASPAAERMGGD